MEGLGVRGVGLRVGDAGLRVLGSRLRLQVSGFRGDRIKCPKP